MRSIYITSAEGNTGKSTIALGVIETLKRSGRTIGLFRPVSRSDADSDYILEFLLEHLWMPGSPSEYIGATYGEVHADPDAALAQIVGRFQRIASDYDVMVILGSDYTDVATPTELAYNARVATNLGAPVLLVLGGRGHDENTPANTQVITGPARTPEEMAQATEIALTELRDEHAQVVGIVANRVDTSRLQDAIAAIAHAASDTGAPVWALPEDTVLVAPTLRALMAALDGTLYRGDPMLLDREAVSIVVSGMSMENVLRRLEPDAAVIVPGDRSDVLIAMMLANTADTFPSLAGIIMNGGFAISPVIERLIAGVASDLPIVATELNTFETVYRITRTRGRLAADSQRKTDIALALFDAHVDSDRILALLDAAHDDIVTPIMFEYRLLERARRDPKDIVLPEGDDDRILRAAATVLQRQAAKLTILGDAEQINARAARLDIDLSAATIVSPTDPELRERFAIAYAEQRAHKGMTVAQAREIVTDVSYFGTMLVQQGMADGMVSGAAHTTAHTIRPAFEVIKTDPDVSIVSSVFFMCLEDRVLVYGDCAINPNPTAAQLADIAISSAQTARRFGVDPRVAMLSYSTGTSGSGTDVDKVRTATTLVHHRAADLPVEGPIQYDAAADASVARTKMPESTVAGRATVFIFPDLNTGNNTYKAVQRSAGAVAVGPVLQGLRRPINDLSRGATVKDIVNTIAITVIQAQEQA